MSDQKDIPPREEPPDVPYIRTWQVKKYYDCPRAFYFSLEYKRIPNTKTKETWSRGNLYESEILKDFKGIRSGYVETPIFRTSKGISFRNKGHPCYILTGHPDAIKIAPNLITGVEIKSYDLHRKDPYENDQFQAEVYLFLLKLNFPYMKSKMELWYKNKTFIIESYNTKRMIKILTGICDVLQKRHTIPKVFDKRRVRKTYICSSGKCVYKPLCKEMGYL